jgi:CubicO group peptidase (beta-lactamase class C family)
MTALLIQMLVNDDKLSYDTTLEQALPQITMLEDYRKVTLRDLLLSKAGIIPFQRIDLEDPRIVQKLWMEMPAGIPAPSDQRSEAAKLALSLNPIAKPGSKAVYSNVGWAIAGLIIETASGRPYEDLIKEKIYNPLGMKDARTGGWPASKVELNQPRGHYPVVGAAPRPQELNDAYTFPDWMNPAGGVHCSINDFALYVHENLAGLLGQGMLLNKKGYENIHSVHQTAKISEMYQGTEQSGDVSMGYGWGILMDEGRPVSVAEGSGGTFFALIAAYPALDLGFAGFTNSGDGILALQEAIKKMTGMAL